MSVTDGNRIICIHMTMLDQNDALRSGHTYLSVPCRQDQWYKMSFACFRMEQFTLVRVNGVCFVQCRIPILILKLKFVGHDILSFSLTLFWNRWNETLFMTVKGSRVDALEQRSSRVLISSCRHSAPGMHNWMLYGRLPSAREHRAVGKWRRDARKMRSGEQLKEWKRRAE